VRLYALSCLSALACGRISFAPLDRTSDAAADAVGDAAPVEPNLLLHYAFDATTGMLHDSGPYAHDASCKFGCPTALAGRVGDGAVSFDGTQCVVAPDGPEQHAAAFTIALWIAGGPGNSSTNAMARPLNGATTANDTWEIAFNSTPANVIAGLDPVWTIDAVTVGWHHVALVYDGSKQLLYVDGAAPQGPTASGPAIYATDSIAIGCDINAGALATPYIGAIDDVRVYDRAFTQADVQALMAL